MTQAHGSVGISLVALLFGSVTSMGCEASTGELTPGPRLQIRQTCLRTACGERMASEGRACASCQSACFSAGYDCDPSDACDYSCEDIAPCGDWESECTLEGFEVALPNNPSEEIERACAQLDAHLGACGFGDEISSDDCRRFAVTERPEMAAQYECVATLSCEELTDPDAAARCAVTPSTFGDTLCARMAGICPEGGCNAGTAESLNHVGAFLREDAKDAAMRCAGQDTCDEAVDCFEAWADAVL